MPPLNPSTLSPHCLYDLRGRPRYIAVGDYGKLLPEIVRHAGLAGWLEKIWLQIQAAYPRRALTDRVSLQHWQVLRDAVAAPVTGALFWQAATQGGLQFTGGLTTDDRRFFVKAYQHADDAALARQQSDFVHHYFNTAFTIVPALSAHDRVVLYPLLTRTGRDITTNDIVARLRDLGVQHYRQFDRALKPAIDYVNLNLPHLLQKAGQNELWQRARALLTTLPAMPMVPVHGNLTSDTLFMSDRLSPVLLDYERAGWHVPFYDYWHFLCQKPTEHGQKPDLRHLIKRLQEMVGTDAPMLQAGALLYLLDQIAYDLQDAQDYPRLRAHREKTARVKIGMAFSLLDDLTRAGSP